MRRVAGQGARQVAVALALLAHRATAAVAERHHSVDPRVPVQPAAAEVVRHRAHHRRGAVHRGDHGHVVARTDPPVGAQISLKGCARAFRQQDRRPRIGAELVDQAQLAHRGVLGVDVLAGGDAVGRKSDHLAILAHRRAGRDRAQRHLVPERHPLARTRAIRAGELPSLQDAPGDRDVVGGVEQDQLLASAVHGVELRHADGLTVSHRQCIAVGHGVRLKWLIRDHAPPSYAFVQHVGVFIRRGPRAAPGCSRISGPHRLRHACFRQAISVCTATHAHSGMTRG